MSEVNENSNAQEVVAAPVETPVATGPTVAELQAQLDELKRQSEGRLRDLQQERQRRQEYEARVQTPAVQQQTASAPVDEVAQVVNPYIAPVQARVEQLSKVVAEYQQEKQERERDAAWAVLSSKTGKKRADLEADTVFQKRLSDTVDKWGLRGSLMEVTEKALELMELEGVKAKEQERVRNATISASTPLAGGTPPVPVSGKSFSADAFNRMSPAEFDKLSQSGSFRKVDGAFVYTPR